MKAPPLKLHFVSNTEDCVYVYGRRDVCSRPLTGSLMARQGWQIADFQLRHEPLWRRIVRKFARKGG